MTSPFSFTSKTDGVDDHLAAHVNALQLAADVLAKSPDGVMFNGKLSVSVAANNITVAIKTLDGNTPSATDPVYVVINGTVRSLTTSLSITKNAGTNWFNSGATALATNQVDYFAYAIWNTGPVTPILDLGFARFPYGTVYNDFSATTTNEKYIARSNATNPNLTDDFVVIGRFAAILSATASFNWSVPAFTSTNLIQRPIYTTRRLTWVPSPTGYSAVPTNTVYEYIIQNNFLELFIREGANGTSNATSITMTAPFTAATLTNMAWDGFGFGIDNGAALTTTVRLDITSASNSIGFYPNGSASATWTNSAGKRIAVAYLKFAIG